MDSIEAAARLAALKAAGRGDPSGGPSTQTITEFLLARIAEDEARARGASDGDIPRWTRVLAECEAKRRILSYLDEHILGWGYATAEELADVVLGNLAAPYADHPDYRDEWRA